MKNPYIYHPAMVKTVKFMRVLGYSKGQIAKELGCATSTLRYWAKTKPSFKRALNGPKRIRLKQRDVSNWVLASRP